MLASISLLYLIAVISFVSLRAYYLDPRFARDDYRSIVQSIGAIAGEDDAIILDAPGQQEVFNYYYHGPLPIYLLPAQRPADAAVTETSLQTIAARHARLFVVLWATNESDPARLVETWLDTHAFKSTDNWYGSVRLALYASRQVPGEAQHPTDIRFGDSIVLQGYSLGVESVEAGDILPLTLFWRAEQPVARRYKVFVHLLDPRGFVIAQRDAEPAGGSRPTSGWSSGETIADPYGLFVPFATAPLAYQIEEGLYDPDSGVRLKTAGGDDHLVLGSVGVLATTALRAIPGMLPLAGPPEGGLALLGYQLDKVGAEGQRDPQFHAGDAIHLTLYWRRAGTISGDGGYLLQIGSLARQTTPTAGLYPPGQWQEGEVVRDDQIVALPAGFAAGTFAIQVAGRTIAQVSVQ
jgi:hypothetical protein